MRTFVREKKTYCGEDYLEVDVYNYTDEERKKDLAGGKRSKKETKSLPKQIDWNDINSRRRFLQILEANFGEGDIHTTLTYSGENIPLTMEQAEIDRRNFKRRVEYERVKKKLPPGKYIFISSCTYKKDGITPARIHHHIIMSGGIERDKLEDIWRKRRKKGQKKGDKIGYANADRLQLEENGFAPLCEYLSKQTGGKKRWSSSHNLAEPEKVIKDSDTEKKEEETAGKEKTTRFYASANIKRPWSRTNDHNYSRKEVQKIAREQFDPEYWKKRYPGYEVTKNGFKAVYSDNRGWALYLKLRRVKNRE